MEEAQTVLLSVDAFKDLLGISHNKIWALLKRPVEQGGVRHVRVDGRVYILRSELQEWPARVEQQNQLLSAV